LSCCHSEADCNIDFSLKRLNRMNFYTLCTILVTFGLVTPEFTLLTITPFAAKRQKSTYHAKYQGRQSHRIIGGHKRILGFWGRKSPSGVQWRSHGMGSGGRSPPEAEAFFVKLHITFALKYNKQQLLSLESTS